MLLYTNLFQFVYNVRMSCLNGLLQITPQCINVIKERTLSWPFKNINYLLCLSHSGVDLPLCLGCCMTTSFVAKNRQTA